LYNSLFGKWIGISIRRGISSFTLAFYFCYSYLNPGDINIDHYLLKPFAPMRLELKSRLNCEENNVFLTIEVIRALTKKKDYLDIAEILPKCVV
jgi:hypothetical protein